VFIEQTGAVVERVGGFAAITSEMRGLAASVRRLSRRVRGAGSSLRPGGRPGGSAADGQPAGSARPPRATPLQGEIVDLSELSKLPEQDSITTRYYGWYANRPRGMRRQAEPAAVDAPPMIIPAPRVAPTEATRRWAVLLQQIFEVDPLAAAPTPP